METHLLLGPASSELSVSFLTPHAHPLHSIHSEHLSSPRPSHICTSGLASLSISDSIPGKLLHIFQSLALLTPFSQEALSQGDPFLSYPLAHPQLYPCSFMMVLLERNYLNQTGSATSRESALERLLLRGAQLRDAHTHKTVLDSQAWGPTSALLILLMKT